MLFRQATLVGIANGSIDLAFRRWQHARVRPGSTVRTALGVVAITSVEPTQLEAISEDEARRAGYTTRAALCDELALEPSAPIYRIHVRFGGADPRIALRERDQIAPEEIARLSESLARLGARTADGPWALRVLRLIEAAPSIRAARLAKDAGMDTRRFKTRVRQLKNLGLTESLTVGYRLSPRGHALLQHMSGSPAPQKAMMRLVQPTSEREWRHARELVEEYAASLNVDLSFQDFAHEIESLAREYSPPTGAFLLAEQGGVYIGCVAVRQFSPDTGEIKRLYVRPVGRGLGLGRRLAEGIIAAARNIGFNRLLLDTLPSMAEARALYVDLGFTPIEPYRFNPVPGTAFLELKLR